MAKQNNLCSLKENNQIQEQGVVLHVVKIELQLLHRVVHRRPVGITNLRPTRDARCEGGPAWVDRHFPAEVVHERRTLWPRADEAHVAGHDIDELRQLIDARKPDEFPHPRDAIVVFLGPSRDAVLLRVNTHAAKLEDFEYLPGLTDPFLPIQNRPAGLEPDSQRSNQHDWQSCDQHRSAHAAIECTLQELLKTGFGESLGTYHPARAQ